jgi:hypothetical protein
MDRSTASTFDSGKTANLLIPNSLQMQEECFMVGFTMHNKENK